MFSLKAAAAASICLLPLHAFAQAAATPADQPLTNWVTIGGQYQSGGSDYLGRFSGAVDPGFYFLGDFHYGYRDKWDSGGTTYFEMNGANLGLPDRSFNAKVGQQGTWGAYFSYDGIPYNASPMQSVWQSTGALVPGVAPGSIPLAFPGTPFVPGHGIVNSLWLPTPNPGLAGLLASDGISTQRDIFTGGGKYQFGDWTISASIRHEHKSGYQENSLELGGTVALTSAGTGGSANHPPTSGVTSGLGYFAQPIDYDTDRYDVTAAYANDRLQAQVGYTYSQFTDNLTEFNAINPFGFNPTTSFGTAAANLSAPYALPPSNSAHEIKVMLGYNVSPTMRVNANFAYGLELQNSAYVTGTGDPANTETEPRTSFDGVVQTLFGNVAMTAQPLPKLDLRLSYTIDDRDNQSPRDAYEVNTRDNASTNNNANGDCLVPSAISAAGACSNLPFSYEHQTITAEAGYSVLPHTKVSLNDTYEITYRNYADASLVTSNTVTAKVRSPLFDDVFGALSYSHQDRDAHNYVNNNTWDLLGANTAASPTNIADPTGFLVYFEASRVHDDVKGSLDVSPTDTLTASLMAKFSSDRYPWNTYGLLNNHNIEVGPDVSWQVTPALMAHGFYTFQQIYNDQSNLYVSGTNYTATGTGYYVPWTNKTTDSVHTAGVSLDWQAVKDVLKFSLDYSFAYGDTAYALGDGMALIGGAQTSPTNISNLTLQPLPNVTSMLNTISIRGEYTFRPNMTVIFGYEYERFSYKDFMNDTSPTAYANALLPGTLNPNDSVHVIGAGLRVRF
jgi:MtrB/PioB family decaheme-associated outer membrane protein